MSEDANNIRLRPFRQTNSDGQTPEEIDGVGEREQKKVREYVVSRVGPRIE